MTPITQIVTISKEIYVKAKDIVKKSINAHTIPIMPDDSDDNKKNVESFCKNMYSDSLRWRQNQAIGRYRGGYSDIAEAWKASRKLIDGNHWVVWEKNELGRKTKGNEWKTELQDAEISNQIRTKVEYISHNWHELVVTPNIKYINQILDKERGDEWNKEIRSTVWKAKVEGSVHLKTCLEKDENGIDVFRERVVDNESIFPTPNSFGVERHEGCWYLIYARSRYVMDVVREFPDIDKSIFSDISATRKNEISFVKSENTNIVNYSTTKDVEDLRFYCDDDTLVDAEIDENEITKRIDLLSRMEKPEIKIDDNHLAFIQAYYDVLLVLEQQLQEHAQVIAANQTQQPAIQEQEAEENFTEEGKEIPTEEVAEPQQAEQIEHAMQSMESEEFVDAYAQELIERMSLMQEQIQEHYNEIVKLEKQGMPIGKEKKYPFGRYIVMISDKIVEDKPNPYNIEWRMLFHKIDNEKIHGSYYGRSDVEILWDANKTQDTMKSYTADVAVSVGFPKTFIKETEKQTLESFNNNFLEPAIYREVPPTFRQGSAPRELLTLYELSKRDAALSLGVSSIVQGNEPFSGASGELVKTLLTQSLPQVAGEFNANLNTAIERMMKTRIMLMKEFYKEPRVYYLNGEYKNVNVSESLIFQEVRHENGEITIEEIPDVTINVKPNSNFPNQFESELNFIITAYNTLKFPDGAPMVPAEAIYDVLGQRFPQFAENGEWRQKSKIYELGLQVMRQMQAQEQQRQLQTQQMTNMQNPSMTIPQPDMQTQQL